MSHKGNDQYNENMAELECTICHKHYTVEESYGVNGSDEYLATEIGHAFDCPFRNIDPKNRKFVKEVQIV